MKHKILEDKFGNPYFEMDEEIYRNLPDSITLTVQGKEVHFFLERRAYLPRNENDSVNCNTILGIRYVSSKYMAENAIDISDER